MTPCPTCGAVPTADAAFCGACGGKLGGRSSDPLIGQTIAGGRYQVLRRLGEGGMGTVYEVEQVSLRRRAALKVLKPALFDQPGVLRRFQSEAELAARLSHPNTVTLFDFGTMEDGGRFMTMELVTGRTLRAELERAGAIPLPRAIGIVRQIASSLADAHAAGIVHRDLKPDNVMLSERAGQTDFVRVLDFGIAKLRDERAGGITAMPQTQAGSLVGTPQYMSPEQITGSPVDPRTDVYALGCLMYQIITGRLPFTGTTLTAVLAQHLQAVPPPMTKVRADLALPRALDALVLACLEKDPNRRPPSMTAVLGALDAITTSAMSAPTPVSAPMPASPSSPAPAVAPAPTVNGAPAAPRRGLPLAVRVLFGAAGIAAMIVGGLQLRSSLKSSTTAPVDSAPASASAPVPPPSAPAAASASDPGDPDRPLGWPAADPSLHSVPAPVLPAPAPAPTPTPSQAPAASARKPPRFTRRGAWMVTTGGTRVSLPFASPQVTTDGNTFVAIAPIAPGEAAAVTGAVSVIPPGDLAAMAPPLFQTLATTLGATVTVVDRQPLAGHPMHHATITGPAATFHAYVGVVGNELLLVAIGGPETPAMHEVGARWVANGLSVKSAPTAAP